MNSPDRPTPKAQRTRKKILDTALRLFIEQGFDETPMRTVAKEAQVSLGSMYYHFRSKEALVLAYYADTQDAAEIACAAAIDDNQDFETCFRNLLDTRLQHLKQARSLVKVLARGTADPDNVLSPFHESTSDVRKRAIDLIEDIVNKTDVKVHQSLRPRLPQMLWLIQMAVIWFWTFDSSKDQEKTAQLLDKALPFLTRLLKLSATRLPGVSKINANLIEIVELVLEETSPP